MNKIILLLLITFTCYAQVDKLLVGNRNAYAAWTAITGTNILTSTDVFFYGSYTRAITTQEAGAKSASKYMHWKVNGGTFDSTRTLGKTLALSTLTDDTTYTYKCVVIDADGRYSAGIDSTFDTPLFAPENLSAEIYNGELYLDWSENTRTTGYILQNKLIRSS